MKPKLSSLFLALILVACNNPKDRIQGEEAFTVSFDNCKTTIDLNLSDLIDTYSFIKLETTPESLIGNNPGIILAKDHIIIIDMNGVFKFDKEGKFIRKIIKFGRGPDEISSAINYTYSDKKNQLLIEDNIRNKDKLQVFDIENEKFLEPIRKFSPGRWGGFLVYNDSLIMGSMVQVIVDTNRYASFIQNSKGKVVSGITNSRKVLDARLNQETVQRLQFYQRGKDIFTFYVYDDTLFSYSPTGLIPYLIVSYNSPRNYMRTMGFKVGESRVSFPTAYNTSYILLIESIYTGESQEGAMTKFNYSKNYFFLNLTDNSFSKIISYTDNICGKVQECKGEMLNFPVTLPENKIYVLYNPNELMNSSPSDYNSLPTDIADQLQKIREGLNIMDNPVLLIGSIKKNIKIRDVPSHD